MDVEVRRGIAEASAAEDDWQELFEQDEAATPFSSPGWARPWMRHFGEGLTPWVVTVRREGRLAGMAAFVLVRRGSLRLLRVLGKEPADYWDVLARPADRAGVTASVFAALHELRREWDLLVLDALPPLSGTGEALADSPALHLRRRASIPCPGVSLPGTLDEYLAGLQRRRRTKFRRHLRVADEGEVDVRRVEAPAELPEAIDAWHALRRAQWSELPGREMFELQGTDRFRDFMRDVALELVPAGLAELREMRRDGALVGSYLSFVDARAYYLYLGGFDPIAAKLELGSVNLCLSIRASIEAGLGYFDFMAGAEPYKYWYGATDRSMTPLVAGNSRLRSRIALAASRLRDAATGRGGG
jgi:CelD/BcsL family acetyltransferase involved in cellulose biosynthesis